MKLNKKQIKAIEQSDSPFSVITGGAGTGKTTIIKEIVRNISDSIPALVCPTGKAAARLREASGIATSTIHSLMRYNFNSGTFMINDLSPYTLIIDEASMMDSWLFSSIIDRKPHRICLAGDFAQLPPVG
ncbi:ATP-dependent RecD-like DNA helicase, partial [bacterium]